MVVVQMPEACCHILFKVKNKQLILDLLSLRMNPSVFQALCNVDTTHNTPGYIGPRIYWLMSKSVPWSMRQQPILVLLSEKSHSQRSLSGYSQQGCTKSDTTEATQHAYTLIKYVILIAMAMEPIMLKQKIMSNTFISFTRKYYIVLAICNYFTSIIA